MAKRTSFEKKPEMNSGAQIKNSRANKSDAVTRHFIQQEFFRKSEFYSPEKILSLQMQQARILLQHAIDTIPYYKKALKDIDLSGQKTVDLDTWLKIPLLKRVDLQENYESLSSTKIPNGHGRVHVTSTSGSTGLPVRVNKTQLNQFFWNAVKVRDHLWHERKTENHKHSAIRFVEDETLAQPPNGQAYDSWSFPLNAMFPAGTTSLLSIGSTVSDQLKWLYKENPEYLLTYPSNLFALAKQYDKNQCSKLKQIITVSECLDIDVREHCEEVFGVPIKDIYSSQEIGYIALQCPQNNHYHVQSETVLVEVLDENDKPCKTGEVGRVVLTSLHNFAMPLIRYDVGDYAEVGEKCNCGRGLPVLKQIYGRVRNMLTFPSGEKVWPRIRTQFYAETAGADIKQAQLIQNSLTEIEINLVSTEQITTDQEAKLTKMLHKALGFDFDISYKVLPDIPRSKSGKFEEFISKIS